VISSSNGTEWCSIPSYFLSWHGNQSLYHKKFCVFIKHVIYCTNPINLLFDDLLSCANNGNINKDKEHSWHQRTGFKFKYFMCQNCGLGSIVGIAIASGWTVQGVNPGGGGDFLHLSRLTLGPTQPPVQWVLGLSWGRCGRVVGLTPTPI